MTKLLKLAKQLLIATPSIDEDTIFNGSLIYIKEHAREGSFGLIINKPSDMRLCDLHKTYASDKELCIERNANQPVYIGGSVNTSRLYVLYVASSPPDTEEEDLIIKISTDDKLIENILAGKGPYRFMIMLGCSMWNSGQLDEEFVNNSWVAMPCVPAIMFDSEPAERAMLAARHLGFNLNMLHA